MKRINYSFLRMISALVLGLLLVMYPGDAANYLVIAIGVLFIIPGFISLVSYFTQRNRIEEEVIPSPILPVSGIGSLLFGLWLVIMPSFFGDMIVFLLGFVLVLGGVQQVNTLLVARKWMSVPGKAYIIPVLLMLAGVTALFNPTGVRETTFLLIGVSSLIYFCSELFNWFCFTRKRPKFENPLLTEAVETDIVDE